MAEFTEESLSLLCETAKSSDAAGHKFAVVPLPSNKFATVDTISKTVTVYDNVPPKRDHKLLSIMDVVGWTKSHDTSKPIVWIGNDVITVTLDDEPTRVRGDRAVYTWRVTPEFDLLTRLSKMSPDSAFDQAALLRLLRTTLWNNFQFTDQRDALVKSLRNVVAQQTTALTQGRGTYEASMATTTGQAELWPERLAIQARVFDDTSLVTLQPIDVVFDVDAQKKQFSLWPTVSSLTAASTAVREHASEMIRAQLVDTAALVFAGSP